MYFFFSCRPISLKVVMELVTPILYILLCILIITGNLLVITTVTFTRSLHSTSNLLIASLSVADLCVGLLTVPFRVSEIFKAHWTTTIEYCRISHGLVLFNLSASMFHITVIAIDRYLAAFHPFKYNAVSNNKRSIWLGIALTWLISILIAFLPAMGLGASSLSGERKLSGICIFAETLHSNYLLVYACCIFFGSFMVVTLLYGRIFILAREHIKKIAALDVMPADEINYDRNIKRSSFQTVSIDSTMTINERRMNDNKRRRSSLRRFSIDRALHPNNTSKRVIGGPRRRSSFLPFSVQNALPGFNNSNNTMGRQRKIAMEFKAAKVMAIVVGTLYICWLPNIISIIMVGLCRTCLNQVAISIIVFLVYSNSGMNPVIYYSRYKFYRQATKRMFGKICPC